MEPATSFDGFDLSSLTVCCGSCPWYGSLQYSITDIQQTPLFHPHLPGGVISLSLSLTYHGAPSAHHRPRRKAVGVPLVSVGEGVTVEPGSPPGGRVVDGYRLGL